MAEELYTREVVCERLQISPQMLLRYEQVGLIEPRIVNNEVRYGRAEIRRAWTVVSLHRDLGINLAGVEAVLHLQTQLLDADRQVRALLRALEQSLEQQSRQSADRR